MVEHRHHARLLPRRRSICGAGHPPTRRQRAPAASPAYNPDQLDQLIGPRPADPVGADTWDDAVADIARWRSTHHLTQPGIGAAPDDPATFEQWRQLNVRLAATRAWLVAVDRHEPSWPATRPHAELIARRHTLEAIFDAAPPDASPMHSTPCRR